MKKDIYNTYLGKAYRFIGFKGFEKTIENKSLRFSRIDTFNDPLDCSPYLAYNWDKYNYSNGLTDIIKNHFFAPFYNSMFACCFCKKYDTLNSYLMWSHYGEKHTQLCFEIDFSHKEYLGGPSEITYPEDLCKFREELKNKNSEERGLFLATTKLKQWSYEEEVRLIIDISFLENSSENYFENNHRYLNYPLDLNIISKVIFGINAEKSNELWYNSKT